MAEIVSAADGERQQRRDDAAEDEERQQEEDRERDQLRLLQILLDRGCRSPRTPGRARRPSKGALASILWALVDVKDQDAVRVRMVCVPDEESEDVDRRSTDELVKEGLRGFRHHRRAHQPAHRRPAKGVLGLA